MRKSPLHGLTVLLALTACGREPVVSLPVPDVPSQTLSTLSVGRGTATLRSAITASGIRQHLVEFQSIADANGGNRAAHLPGYTASLAYVQQMLAGAGYRVTVQPFTYDVGVDRSTLRQLAPVPVTYSYKVDYFALQYSPETASTITAPVHAVDVMIPPGAVSSSTSGCEATDFAGFPAGSIALIQRGSCNFAQKAANAQAAGAVGVLIFNEGQPGRTAAFNGTLGPGSGVSIPVIGTSFAVGRGLYDVVSPTVSMSVDFAVETRQSANLLATSTSGRPDRTIVVGAHLDSVDEGPGINDNGSGTAAILETALQMARLRIQPVNRLQFAFWGAEELGLIGSQYYVSQLTASQIKGIAMNLNFDMVASPNFVRFVYDGDGSTFNLSGPSGSGTIEKLFNDYFAQQGLATLPSPLNGRSDYLPFIEAGIPAGGLFTGAEDVKSAEQAEVFGGTAGVAYDPCYHAACDTLANVNNTALDQMGDAIAHAVMTFATTPTVNLPDRASNTARSKFSYLGPFARR